jgi:capsular polysaccharide biosynthesis protein
LEAIRVNPDTQGLIPRRHPNFVSNFVQGAGLDHLLLEDGTWFVRDLLVVERDPYTPLVKQEIEALAQHFLQRSSYRHGNDDGTKIYVSRVGSSRSLDFEQELEEYLEAKGFITLRADGLSDIYQNAEIFAQARTVIGPHGAGLANIVFCAQGTKVIEIATHNWWNSSFSSVAQLNELAHCVMYLSTQNLHSSGSAREVVKQLTSEDIE